MAKKRIISKRLMLLVAIAIVLLAVIVILIVRSKQSPSVSADVNSDQLMIEGSLPPLD